MNFWNQRGWKGHVMMGNGVWLMDGPKRKKLSEKDALFLVEYVAVKPY